MRIPLVLAIVSVSSGCMLDVWTGGYAVKQPNGTSPGFTLGASLGAYIDPVRTRTKVALSAGTDRVWNSSDTADKLTQNGAQLHVEVGLSPSQRSEYDNSDLRRITAIITLAGKGFSNLMPVDPMAVRNDSTAAMYYLGYTKELVQNPGHIWRDTVSWSIGPAYGSWSGGDFDGVSLYGVQAHFNMSFSPLVVLSIFGQAGHGVSEVARNTNPSGFTPTSSSSTTTTTSSDGCAGGYYRDQCDVNGKNCHSVWTCP